MTKEKSAIFFNNAARATSFCFDVTRNKTNSTIFKHVMGDNGFHTFSSHKYYRETPHDMFIALQKDGIPRKGNKTCRLHKGSQFLII
ncbi:hypothetical protein P5673_011529 [Acropora cervicornis]|uniref:Uncharacterized protein n=1 Tax=Acropora cervicornis TaxID=6130 RepID=A0AAD9QP35_ACRCE|nr:hypothetical protein P5673_011529 [Acropora cervicornis]